MLLHTMYLPKICVVSSFFKPYMLSFSEIISCRARFWRVESMFCDNFQTKNCTFGGTPLAHIFLKEFLLYQIFIWHNSFVRQSNSINTWNIYSPNPNIFFIHPFLTLSISISNSCSRSYCHNSGRFYFMNNFLAHHDHNKQYLSFLTLSLNIRN